MNPTSVEKMFNRVKKDLRDLFDDGTTNVIREAVGLVNSSYKRYNQGKQSTWGYTIYPDRPMKFRTSQRPTQDNHVDLYCEFQWGDNELPVSQDIKIRVWGLHDALIFREGLDALKIQEALTDPERSIKGRVISRYHFDRVYREGSGKVSPEYHPKYHLQIGGKSLPAELCWHPETFDIPRIPHHPMDLFLACQLIAINFFPDHYKNIQKESEWHAQVANTQRTLLEEYYKNCLECIRNGDSLMDMLREP